jgi:uncharacterized protein
LFWVCLRFNLRISILSALKRYLNMTSSTSDSSASSFPTSPEQAFAAKRLWAVVGVSTDREKYGNKIFRQLRDANYKVYAVNPKLTEVEGLPCYASLAALPEVPEVVNVVVPPAAGLAVVEACLALGIKNIWFQPGAESDEAISRAEKAGLNVLANACILLQYQTWPTL